ncbi:tetratricopeptide repeat protein, partial [Candidatus Poribacteria bacterium]|nr:tetratricopeptide repeat protein [Candidatus Poribacteria bacterium]MYK21993.1 tetratricopeptide repeat protein [Candidatus Poribacteria bacterium]
MRQNGKFLFVFLALGLFISCAQAPQQLVSEKPAAPVVDLTPGKIRDSIVLIQSENVSGTGFFVTPDRIATNTHVVAHAGTVSVKSPDKEKDWTIEGVIGFDAKNSLVLLKVAGEGTPLPLGKIEAVQIDLSVSIPGYRDGEFKVVEGKIQSIRKHTKWLRIKATKETDGSPVLNNKGQVIGVIVPYGSYAVPSSALAALLDASLSMEPLTEWQQREQIRAAAYYGLGKEKFSVKDYTGALIDFDKAIAFNPAYVRAYYERGKAQFYLGDYDNGVASLTQMIKIDPEDADAYYGRGTVKVLFGDYAGAIVDFDKAIELDAQHATAYRNRGGVKFRLGESESARGNTEEARRLYESAIADCTKAIQIDPEDADAYNRRGAAKLAFDNFEEAIRDFNRAIQIDAEDATIYNNRGSAKLKFGESENARGNADEARRLYEAGVQDYTQAIRLDPENVNFYGNRGAAKLSFGELESARGNSEKTEALYEA